MLFLRLKPIIKSVNESKRGRDIKTDPETEPPAKLQFLSSRDDYAQGELGVSTYT